MAAVPEVSSGSAGAAHDLFERYRGPVFGYCLHQLGSREEAEDATQTTFLNAFKGLQRGIVPELEAAWLFKIAHNVCLTRRRSSWRRGRVETPGDMQALQDVVAAPARPETDELMEVRAALEAMPASQRTAILLREWQGLSYREIAEHMETSEAAVETLIFRARRSLAKGLLKVRHALDLGAFAAAMKGLLSGGAAVKAAATVAAVTTAAVVGATAIDRPDANARLKPAAALDPSAAVPVLPRRVEPPTETVVVEDMPTARAPEAKAEPKPRAKAALPKARPKAKAAGAPSRKAAPAAAAPEVEKARAPQVQRHEPAAKRAAPVKAEPKPAKAPKPKAEKRASKPVAQAQPKAKPAPRAQERGKTEAKGKGKP